MRFRSRRAVGSTEGINIRCLTSKESDTDEQASGWFVEIGLPDVPHPSVMMPMFGVSRLSPNSTIVRSYTLAICISQDSSS
jgi:hypothetical protein